MLSACMIGGMMPLPASAEESVSGNTVQTESTEQVQENGEAGTGGLNKENKQPGAEEQSSETEEQPGREEAPSEDEKSSETDNETESETMTVLGFAALDTSIINQTLSVGASEADIKFPDKLTVTIQVQNESESADSVTANDADTADTTETSAELSGITWKLDETESDGATFDSSEVCNGYCYVYTPVLPETDADGNSIQVADGVELPMIYVLIGEQQLMTLAAEADHYDENGFCKGYEIDPNGSGAWVKKSGADACTDDTCKGYQPATTTKDGDGTEWVEISNAGQLYWFASQVDNNDLINANVRLTADIVDNEGVTFSWDENNDYAVVATKDGQQVDAKTLRMWNPIGEKQNGENHWFTGHFDGQGHTVSGLYYDSQDMNKDAGIFWRVCGTSECYTIIERVGLENSYLHSRKGAGGITGYAYCASISQCYNAAYLVSANISGGIAAMVTNCITLSEVFNFGEIMIIGSPNLGPYRGQIIGDIIGKPENESNFKANCCYARSDLNIESLDPKDHAYDIHGEWFFQKESFYNGEVAYQLSQLSSSWGQNLSSDNSLPTPCASDKYPVYKTCKGYTNNENEVHHNLKNGLCTNAGCDYYTGEPTYNEKDDVYEISNAGQLYAYADKAQTVYKKGARLTADIVVNEETLIQEDGTPVAKTADIRMWDGLFRISSEYLVYDSSESRKYYNYHKLVFDGNNHSISGLYAKGSGLQGFALHNYGTVKNLQIKNSVFISTNGRAGGIDSGYRERFESPYDPKADHKVVNCSFEGYVEGASSAGGITGYGYNSNNISNCYVDAYVKGGNVNPIAPDKATILNTAYNTDKYTAGCTTSGVTGFTTDQFVSGEVAYTLNNNDNSDTWKQTLDGEAKDSTPTLNTSKANVYRYESLRCDGETKTTDDGKYGYTNDSSKSGKSIKDEHVYEIDLSDHTHHKCKVCGDVVAHDYTYKVADGTKDTIRAVCDVCGDSYTVKLSAPAGADGKLTYTGTELTAGTDITDGTLGEKLPDVEYATVTDGTVSAYSKDAPVNAGSYSARLTLGSGDNAVSATVDYTIEQATPVIGWSDDQKEQSAFYTGTAIASSKLTAPTVTLQGNDTFSDSSKIIYSYRKMTDGTASSEFISGLPADIGTYEIKATIPAEGNYTAAETADTMQLTIAYLDNAPDAVVTDKNNKTYNSDAWCPSDIVLKAPDGYKISMEVKGDYEASCTYTGSTENETITYYLRADNSGEIAEKSVTVKMDWTAPDFSSKPSGINIRKNWWNSLLSTITFDLYKGSLDVNIKADDSQSGVAEYYYYIDNSGSTTVLTAEELDTKTFTKVDAGKNGTTKLTEITSDNDYVIYAYAVDAAGNRSIYISSDGVVLDNTAPKLTDVSVPAKSNETLSDTSATITFTGSEAGTYYYILKENGKPAPTVMSDFAAKTAGDKVDTWTAKDGVSTGTLTADEANTIKLTGLKANTGYVLYLAATDAAGNASVVETEAADGNSGIVSVSFTTAKTTPYVEKAPVLSGTYGNKFSELLWSIDDVVVASQGSTKQVIGSWSIASEDLDKIPTVGTSEKYTLVFTPTGSDADTYDSVTCEVIPEVSKKQITVVIADKEKFYGETNPAFTWSLATGDAYPDNVLVADDTKEALGISLSTTAKDNSNVGTYAITGLSVSSNYEVSFIGNGSDGKSGILTVKQAANSFTTELSCSNYTYAKDETPEPNATAKFGTVTYKYATAASDGTAYKAPSDASAYTDAIPVNAGTYAVKAYVAETENYAGLASDPVVFTINKAASPNIGDEEKSYSYAAGSDGKAISVDIAGKLPTDRGTTAYAVAKTDTEQFLSEVTVDTAGNLTYKVNQVDSSKVGKTAIITVTASMENYANAGYTLTISITDKKTVEIKRGNSVSVDGSNVLIYGEKISKLTLGNTVFVEAGTDDVIEGILSWSNPDEIPVAGTTQAGWVFKPADSKHYEELTGTAAITVARATPAVVTVPAVAERVYNPAVALADSDMTGGSVTGADGNELAGTWSFTGKNIIPTVNNKGYQAVFTPDDTNNYSTATRTITVIVTKATPVIAEKPTAGALTYGQELSDSTLTGGKAAYQTADGTEITGAFVWKNSSSKPTVADSQKTGYDVVFTPSDKDNYNAVDTKLTLTVNKAAQAPNMPQAAMAPAHSTKKVGDITLPDGWSWQEADKDTALADGVAVTANAIYTGADKGNYETESVSITITRSKCEHTQTEIRNQREATCKKEGYTGDTYCKDCGEKLATGTATVKKAHTVGTPATCVSKAVCSVCGETFGEVDATNHVHTTVKNRKEATCTQTGYAGDTYCTDCDKLLSTGKELAALGHDYKATVTKQPTTTEEGIRTYTCTRCNSSYTESIAKLPEEKHTHNYTGSITKEATCTEAGVRTYTCSCGDSYTENIPATGHSYVSKVTKAATTTEEGIMTYTCSKCGHSYTQPIAKIKSDDSSKDNGSQNQKPQSGTDNGNQNQKPQPNTDNGKEKGDSIKPYIKDDSGKEGWDVIKPQLEEAKAGDTVTVAMNGTTVVPKDVIDSIKGKDTTLVLDMGNGLSWKIYGKDITDAAGDIDFDVTVGADAGKSIPVDVINNVTGEHSSLNLTLAYDGEFGFTATLTVNMESKNAGLYANLFYYNEQTGELEFISAGQIDPDGNVELVFTHASDYTIVVDAKIMSDNGQADNKSDETIPAPKTDDSTSKYAWNNTIIIIVGICIILIAFGAVFYVRKKSGSEEE